MTQSTRSIVRGLLQAARESGIPLQRELALSETFFDEAVRKMPAAEARFRKKLEKARKDLERDLGPAKVRNGNARWTTDGTEVHLSLTHEDKEMPFVLAVRVEHRASLRAKARAAAKSKAKAKPAPRCTCTKLVTRRDPFFGESVFLVRDNPSITKSHVRVAQTKVAKTTIQLLQCKSCGQLRQTGERDSFFEVPEIGVAAWKREPYADYLAWKTYETALRDYFETADRTTTNEKCKVKSCRAKAVRFSVFCFDHHDAGRPLPPPGRPLDAPSRRR